MSDDALRIPCLKKVPYKGKPLALLACIYFHEFTKFLTEVFYVWGESV